MDNEVEVEKMAKTVNGLCRVPCKGCKERALCEVLHIAEELVEEGYRKADEVRKETAKEILEYLRAVQEKDELKNYDLDWIAMQYGIEVDE